MNVFEMWLEINFFNDGEKVDVWIMDLLFFDNVDVVFVGGVSFFIIVFEKDGECQVFYVDFCFNFKFLEQGICNGYGIGVVGIVVV